ncbi:hypothetical protein L1887_34383 [Cichorium endivia]|nr:hypothetical protein L1887_34383 [Cichorium endivia]
MSHGKMFLELCVLQEAGEAELVLQIGESLLKEKLPKSFKHDVVLAMALSCVEISRDTMTLSPPYYIKGYELLKSALKLLQLRNENFVLYNDIDGAGS